MTRPADKKIGDLAVSVDFQGWPRWTRISKAGEWVAVLDEEQARDMHYAFTRIVAFLEDAKQCDRLRGIIA